MTTAPPKLCWPQRLRSTRVNQTSACYSFIQHCWWWMFSCQVIRNSLEIMWVVRTHSVQQFPICSFAVSCLPFTQRWLDSHVLITFGLRHVILYFKTLLKNGFDGWLISVLRHSMSFFLSSLPHPDQSPAINLTSAQPAYSEPAGAPSGACVFVPWECVYTVCGKLAR